METTVEGETTITLVNWDRGVAYTYIPAENMAIKISLPDITTPIEEVEKIVKYEYEFLGTETVDGKPCRVYQYTLSENQTTSKLWIWTQYGITLKVVWTDSEGKLSTWELKNVVIGDVPDDLFVLPPGIQILELPG